MKLDGCYKYLAIIFHLFSPFVCQEAAPNQMPVDQNDFTIMQDQPLPVLPQLDLPTADQHNYGQQGNINFQGATVPVNAQYPNLPDHHRPKSALGMITQSKECALDVFKLCGEKPYNIYNDFDVLYCLSNHGHNEEISTACQQYVWSYKVNSTNHGKLDQIARILCKQPLSELDECKNYMDGSGKLLSCLLDNRHTITVASCTLYLTKIETIIFSDYRLIGDFVDVCKEDIIRLECGKLGNVRGLGAAHSQGEVVRCMEDKIAESIAVDPKCSKQILRLAELSADDYHLDRFLYFKCKGDRETLCFDVSAGRGRVYKCLFDHKYDPRMSLQCRDALTGRQKVVAVDYKASYGLISKCQNDIELHHCNQDGNVKEDVLSLSKILLCLEDQNLEGMPVADECDVELADFRRMLMEDYELSPELTHSCSYEIMGLCGGGVKKEGRTLHCLMQLAQDSKLNASCQDALMGVIKETEVVQDYRMDLVLMHNCQSFIGSQCGSYSEGDPEVLSCLMDHVHDNNMPKKCRDSLLELQYFVSRDFNIDPNFREFCRDEAQRLCSVPQMPEPPGTGFGGEWEADDTNNALPIPLSMIISCLYRHIHARLEDAVVRQVGVGLSAACEDEVHLVMRQRALDVKLNPELEEKCRIDLGKLCSEQYQFEIGSEFVCLQDHYDEISEEGCRLQIQQLTQMEGQNTEDFDNILISECESMLQKYCSEFVHSNDDGRIMECLLSVKDDMDSRECAAGLTHFQLIEMKDYHFSYKFLKSCENDIADFCHNEGSNNKADIVKCLSFKVRNAILGKTAIPLSSRCQQQLTVEKLQMHKSIDMNREMKRACSFDTLRYCKDIKAGRAQVIECLRSNKDRLSEKCYQIFFQFEVEESEDQNLDFVLMRSCKNDIREHCFVERDNGRSNAIIDCLLTKKHLLRSSCRHVLVSREKEMFSDLELNPELTDSCNDDIERFCLTEKAMAEGYHRMGKDPHGVIYSCLKQKFTEYNNEEVLSSPCYKHIEFVIKEEQQNYILDPQLTLNCVQSIRILCPPKESFNVVECLKVKYLENLLTKEQSCMAEIAHLLKEGHSDVMADPILHQLCAHDISQHCRHVPEGHSRVITCLMNVLKLNSALLSVECHDQLLQRKSMWEAAIKNGVHGLSDLTLILVQSENSSYFITMLIMITVILFMVGVKFGRFTKRVAHSSKNL